MACGCKIIKDFKRPDVRLVEQFEGMPVANIDDNMGRIAAVDAAIRPVGQGQLLGVAFTVRVPQGDNLMFHAAMDLAKLGDVIVIDAGAFTERAIFGELMASYCKVRGIRGIVCDGAIRDSAALAAMEDFQVYARAVSPNGPYKNDPGEINVPVSIGGKIVHPGDIVVGDADCVLFIDPLIANEVFCATEAVAQKEAKILSSIVEKGEYKRPWVNEKLLEINCEISN